MERGNVDYSVMGSLAELHLLKSEYLEARSIHVQIVQNSEEGHHSGLALLNIAEIDLILGANVHDVQQTLDNAKAKLSDSGLVLMMNQYERILADVNLKEGNEIAAKHLLQKCLNTAWGSSEETVSYCL
ncbi:hypothetical protein C8R44DRAFT_779210, partial [Mycena epipterygia]